ncbi:MAG: tetratricopeptide repeat protein [Acidobacteriota bacterium]
MNRFLACVVLLCLVFSIPNALGQQQGGSGGSTTPDRPSEGDQPQPPPERERSEDRQRGFERAGTIRGRVLMPIGVREIPNISRVDLTGWSSGYRAMEVVRDEGTFEFRGVPPGEYTLRLDCPGFEPVEQQVRIEGGTFGQMDTHVVMHVEKLLEEEIRKAGLPGMGQHTVPADILAVPQKAMDEMEKAEKEGQEQNYDKAIKHLEKSLEIHPDFYLAYNSLAVQYLHLGQREQAVQALEKSISLKPEYAVSYRNLGVIHLQELAFERSLQPLRKALDLEPDNAETMVILGESYRALGQFVLALKMFQDASQRRPTDHQLHLRMAQCYLGVNLNDQAVPHLKRYLASQPQGRNADWARQTISRIEKPEPRN